VRSARDELNPIARRSARSTYRRSANTRALKLYRIVSLLAPVIATALASPRFNGY
jgi:hypothetical protein